jgi:hypothetical protein
VSLFYDIGGFAADHDFSIEHTPPGLAGDGDILIINVGNVGKNYRREVLLS